MKEERLVKNIESLQKEGRFKNDGKGTVWLYRPVPLGIFEPLSKESAFREIETSLQSEMLLHSDVAALYTEIAYSARFYDKKLTEPEPEHLIAVKNGIFDLKTKTLLKHLPDYCLRHGLMISYKKGSTLQKCPICTQYLRRSMNLTQPVIESEPKVKRLKDGIGYSVTNLRGGKKAPILIGAPNSGKSLFLRLVENVVGQTQCVGLTLPDVTDRFRTDFLRNRHLIIIHELIGRPLRRLDYLKKFFAGEPLIVEAKGKQPVEITSYGKPLMASNNMPELGETDVGGGFATRLLPIVFSKTEIPKAERDPKLLEKLMTEADTIFSIILDAAAELLENGLKFADEPEGDALLESYTHECDAVPRFIEERCENAPQEVLSLREVYDTFCEYCQHNCIEVGITKQFTAFRNRLLQMGFEIAKRRVRKGENPRSCLLGVRWKEEQGQWQKVPASVQTSEANEKNN